MNFKNLCFKLRWYIKEHLYIYRNLLTDETVMQYNMPLGYQDFAVHPCVRYVDKGGLCGWWMVLTPYANYNDKLENILLFRGINGDKQSPATQWNFVKEVCGTHKSGYNSDPCLFFDGTELIIYWRECFTENVPDTSNGRCIMCSRTNDGEVFTSPRVVAENLYNGYESKGDTIMCPIVLQYKGILSMYGSMYQFQPNLKPLGITRYIGTSIDEFSFHGFQCQSDNWFDLWHFDLFEYKGNLYNIITGQLGNAIYIGKSGDGKIFKYSKRPLYSYRFFLKKNFFYKATAQVVGDILYVFFPRKAGDGKLKIVMRSMPANLLEKKFKYK